jgi:small subunit ribosomal protein S15
MTISAERKTAVVQKHRRHAKDVGSPEVQVAILTERIAALTSHFKSHKMDHASRRGLLLMVGRRNSLLKYLAESDRERYQDLIKQLGLRK